MFLGGRSSASRQLDGTGLEHAGRTRIDVAQHVASHAVLPAFAAEGPDDLVTLGRVSVALVDAGVEPPSAKAIAIAIDWAVSRQSRASDLGFDARAAHKARAQGRHEEIDLDLGFGDAVRSPIRTDVT